MSQSIQQIRTQFVSALKEIYSERESNNIFDIILQDQFKASKIDMIIGSFSLDETQLTWLENAMIELKNHRPIQQIIGFTYFYDCKFYVNEHTLIPRPETEELVDWILKDFSTGNGLDIGTGTACIPIALAKNGLQMDAIDISQEALKIAQKNARDNNCDINFIQKDILKQDLTEKKWDFIVSNPPYVLDSDKKEMTDSVLNFEPHLALFVPDSDPLLFYREIALKAKTALVPKGKIYFEIHEKYGAQVVEMLLQNGFEKAELRKDLQGKDRMIRATLI